MATRHVPALSGSVQGAFKSSSQELDKKLVGYDTPSVGLGFMASRQQEYLWQPNPLDSTATQQDTALLSANQVLYGLSSLELNKSYSYDSKSTPRVDLQPCTSACNVNNSVSCPSQPHHASNSLELEHINPMDALQVLEDEIWDALPLKNPRLRSNMCQVVHSNTIEVLTLSFMSAEPNTPRY